AERRRELAERAARVVGHAEPVDPARVPLALEPLQVLSPRDEVVDLLDLDATEPSELALELRAALSDRGCPDLRRHDRSLTTLRQRGAERRLRASVHWRGVDEAAARVERGADDTGGGPRIAAERVPRAEPHDGAEPSLFHLSRRQVACEPAGGERGGEELRLGIGPAPHVRERQVRTHLMPFA